MALLTVNGFLEATDVVTRNFLEQVYPALTHEITPAISFAAILYWALSGYKIFAGYAALDWHDLLAKVVMTVAVFGVLSWGGLASQLYNLFVSTMDDAATILLAGEPATDMLGALFINAERISQKLRASSFYQINAIIEGTLILVINSVLFAVALFYMTLSKLGLAVTMVLLPLFIGFALFDATRQWSVNWLSKMMDFALIYLLVVAIVKLGFVAFEQFIEQVNQAAGLINSKPVSSETVTNLFIIEAVLILFMFQVREWAGYLSNGAASQGEALAVKLSGHLRR